MNWLLRERSAAESAGFTFGSEFLISRVFVVKRNLGSVSGWQIETLPKTSPSGEGLAPIAARFPTKRAEPTSLSRSQPLFPHRLGLRNRLGVAGEEVGAQHRAGVGYVGAARYERFRIAE